MMNESPLLLRSTSTLARTARTDDGLSDGLSDGRAALRGTARHVPATGKAYRDGADPGHRVPQGLLLTSLVPVRAQVDDGTLTR